MADSNGNCNGNGDGGSNGNRDGQLQQQWQLLMAWQWQRPMAMAKTTATATETATTIAMATAMTMVPMTLSSQQLTQGMVASLCAGDVQHCGRGDALSPPPGHKGVWIVQSFAMEVPLQRLFAPFQGGGILRAHHVLNFYFYFLHLLFSLLNNPLFPHTFQALKPCQPIVALPPPLLLHLFAEVSLGGACIFVLATCSAVAGLTPLQGGPPSPPPDTKEVALPSAEPWEGPLQRAISPISGGGILSAQDGSVRLFFSTSCSFY